MLTGDAYSSWHLVPSHLGLAYVLLLRPILFPNLSWFFRTTSIFTLNIPRYFFDFAPNVLLPGQSCKMSADIGFHRTFATGVACWQGTLTPPDTWSRPIWDLHMFYLLSPILFPNLSWFFSGLLVFTLNIPRYFFDFAPNVLLHGPYCKNSADVYYKVTEWHICFMI